MVKLKKGWSTLDRSNYVATMNPDIINGPDLSDIEQVHKYIQSGGTWFQKNTGISLVLNLPIMSLRWCHRNDLRM